MSRRILTVAATTAAAVTGAIIVRRIFLNPEVAMSEPTAPAPEVDVPTAGEPTTAGQPDTDAQPQGDAEGDDAESAEGDGGATSSA